MAEVVFSDTQEGRAALAGSHVAFGVFDGVHRGHRYLVERARERAARFGGNSVVLTFDIDPDELFHPDRLMKLLSNEERIAKLASQGVDYVCLLKFDRAFASLTPEEFLDRTFGNALPASVHVGYDIRFGSRALGTLEDLADWGKGNGVEVVGHDLVLADGTPVTATRIRKLIEAGDLEAASKLY